MVITREAEGDIKAILRADRHRRWRDLKAAHEIDVDNSRVGETTEDVSVAVDQNLLQEALVDNLDRNEQSGWIRNQGYHGNNIRSGQRKCDE